MGFAQNEYGLESLAEFMAYAKMSKSEMSVSEMSYIPSKAKYLTCQGWFVVSYISMFWQYPQGFIFGEGVFVTTWTVFPALTRYFEKFEKPTTSSHVLNYNVHIGSGESSDGRMAIDGGTFLNGHYPHCKAI